MNRTSIRLYIVALMILAVYGGTLWVRGETNLSEAEVEMPDWSLKDMPLVFGAWRGEPTELDPEIAAATGADVIVDRLCRNDRGRTVAVHTAIFKDPVVGLDHIPSNCYFTHGWKPLSEGQETIPISDGSTIVVNLSTWQKDGDKVMVAYWYQLGRRVMHSRLDLGAARLALFGQPKWPVLVKVMTQISLTDSDDSKTALLDISEQIARWLNGPQHQAYLDRWPGI